MDFKNWFKIPKNQIIAAVVGAVVLVIAVFGGSLIGGSSGKANSAALGAKAGEWLVNGDAFYNPAGSAAAIDSLCERNYENDYMQVTDKLAYISSCRNAFFDAAQKKEATNDSSLPTYIDSNPACINSNSCYPDESNNSNSTEQPATPEPEIETVYWNPTVANMLNCSKSEEDACSILPHKENTFGKNALKIAQQFIDQAMCSNLITEGVSFTNGKNEAACRVPYNEDSCSAYISAGDSQIWMNVKAPRSWYDAKKAVLKNGLVVTVFCTDYYGIDEQAAAEDAFLARIASIVQGTVESIE